MMNSLFKFQFLILAILCSEGASQTQTLKIGDVLEYKFTREPTFPVCQFFIPNHDGLIIPDSTPLSLPDSRPNGWTYESFGDPAKECGIRIAKVSKEDHGNWTGQSISSKITIKLEVVVISPPTEVSMIEVDQGMVFEAGTSYPIVCRANYSRPAPIVSWGLVGESAFFLNSTRDFFFHPGGNEKGFVTVTDTLNYVAEAKDDGKLLRCSYTHEAALPVDISAGKYQATLNLTVQGKPDDGNYETIFPSQLIIGQEAVVELKIQSNPQPFYMAWSMHDLNDVVVVNISSPSRQSTQIQNGRYTFAPITQEGHLFTAKVTVSELQENDAIEFNEFYMENTFGVGNFTFRFDNAAVVGLSSGAIAGIVIGVLAGIVLIGLIVFMVLKKKKKNKKKRSRNLQPAGQANVSRTIDTGETQERGV